MGAGRTELLESLFGARPERLSGKIILDGQEVRFHHPSEAKQAGVAMVTEDRKRLGLFAEMSVGENITICTLRDALSAGMISGTRERVMAALLME